MAQDIAERAGRLGRARTLRRRRPRGLDLFRFVPFRLNRLAAEVSAALSSEYQERYGLDIPEWRVLATLGFRKDPCSAQYIAHCTRTHKSTISRAVTALMQRRLIERVENAERPPRIPPAPDAQGPRAVRGTDPAALAARAGNPVLPLGTGAPRFCRCCSARSRQASIWCRPAKKRTQRTRIEFLHSWRGIANGSARSAGPMTGAAASRTTWPELVPSSFETRAKRAPRNEAVGHFAAVTTISTICGGSRSTPMQARIGGLLRSTHSSQARFISPLRLMSVI